MRARSIPPPSPLRRRGFSIGCLLLVLVTAAACQAAPVGGPNGTPSHVTPLPAVTPADGSTSALPTAAPATQPAPTDSPAALPESPSPAAEAWPRTLTDDEGTTIELDEQPERLVSLSPANTEIVFALGAGDRLLGGTDFDDYPPEAAELPDVATYNGVILEKVVELEPDLVLAAGNNFTPPADIERMRELGLDVLVVYAASVDEVLADIRLIGEALGAESQADEVVATMEERIAEVESAVAEVADRPRVFYEIGYEPEIYAPAPQSFLADMVVRAGAEPITTTDPTFFSISLERLVALDPEVIVLGDAAYGVCPGAVGARPGWESMTAVREGEIRPVDDTIVTRPGPRLAEGLAALALAIHPAAEISPPEDARELCTEGLLER